MFCSCFVFSVLFCYLCLGGSLHILRWYIRIYITVVKFFASAFPETCCLYCYDIAARGEQGRKAPHSIQRYSFSLIRKQDGREGGTEGGIYKGQAGLDWIIFFDTGAKQLFGRGASWMGQKEKKRPRNTLASRLDTTISRQPHGWILPCMWKEKH